MINHVRTLLLNRGPDGYSPAHDPGEEVVPPYHPRQLQGTLATAHQFLFGLQPDRLFLNFRLAQIMGWLHASDLAEQVFVLDNRITYPPQPTAVAQWFRNSLPDPGWQLIRPAVADEGRGWTSFGYQFTRAGDNVQFLQTAPVRQLLTVPFDWQDGLSAQLDLPASQAGLRATPELAASGQFTLRAQPTTDLGQLLTAWAGLVGLPLAELVFAGSAEPLLRRCWATAPCDTTKYAALLLGFAYYLEHQPIRS